VVELILNKIFRFYKKKKQQQHTSRLAMMVFFVALFVSSVFAGSFEFIVVGSGAGGGPVACRLARNGHKVLLLEAGGGADSAELVSKVPAFHPQASESPSTSWRFFVEVGVWQCVFFFFFFFFFFSSFFFVFPAWRGVRVFRD
jgi:hypothetical protein